MTAISLKLPERLARESMRLARELGISRTELIRRALRHELEAIRAGRERAAMSRALQRMKEDERYLEECEILDQGLATPLPAERDSWWEG